MPANVVKSFADKYGVSVDTAEKKWQEAKSAAENSYGKPPKKAKSAKAKAKSGKFYGTTMKIFKNKMNKLKENTILRFVDFLNENEEFKDSLSEQMESMISGILREKKLNNDPLVTITEDAIHIKFSHDVDPYTKEEIIELVQEFYEEEDIATTLMEAKTREIIFQLQ